jgi:hypothetical protein
VLSRAAAARSYDLIKKGHQSSIGAQIGDIASCNERSELQNGHDMGVKIGA